MKKVQNLQLKNKNLRNNDTQLHNNKKRKNTPQQGNHYGKEYLKKGSHVSNEALLCVWVASPEVF